MLRTLVLTRDYDSRRKVRDAHGGVGGVDVLAAGARRAISIDSQVFVLNVDFDVFVDLGIDKQGSERCMSPRRLVKGRDPDQPVNAGFGSEQPVGILTFNSERHAFQPSFLAWLILENFSFEFSLFSPLEIHAQEHLGPILRLRTTRARMNRANGIAAIVIASQ